MPRPFHPLQIVQAFSFAILGLVILSFCNTKKPESIDESINQTSLPKEKEEEFELPEFSEGEEIFGASEVWTGDFSGMVERRQIRALVPYNRTFYYIDGRHRKGLAFEALRLFQTEVNKKLGKRPGSPGYVQIIFIPVTRDQLIPYLQKGYGDLIAANLTITENRRDHVDFSRSSYKNVRELVVSGPSAPVINDLESISGDTVYVRASSSYSEHLTAFNDSIVPLGYAPIYQEHIDEKLEDDEILEMVEDGIIPMTIVDEHIANVWSQVFENLTIHENFAINTQGEIAWAIRKNSPEMKEVVDEFIRKNGVGTYMGNVLLNRYLKQSRTVKRAMSDKAYDHFKELQPIFVKYGEKYDMDWVLLMAMGYQESGLNQAARSRAGAVGIMQIKPSTGRDTNIGIKDVYTVDNNIHAASKYLDFMRNRYYKSDEVDDLDEILFSMAAYNMGPARLNGIRRRASSKGLDPNKWFNEVELLVAREVGREPVQYISNIFNYYSSFRSLRRYGKVTGKTLDSQQSDQD